METSLWYRNEVIHKPKGIIETEKGNLLARTKWGIGDSAAFRHKPIKRERDGIEQWETEDTDRFRRLAEYYETYDNGVYR